ncbi:hypothetical protein RhiXN_04275 [Rhizoctonia solani]|uniref:3-keto-steroid reductase n=1 Tax=Rhizoctonia solani TaxID=456999 RepID=A0A8H8SSQ8_9AGAM|nr:uncharacterized protein RhiXN_04275 [Rhizoctonia solani]QRW16274.1 hypothetical protein RhiXN_04275 [Rhizoctonia solani]
MTERRPIILVTGANSGVGFGVCHRLLVQLSQKSPPDASPEAQKHPIASPDDEISPFVPADGLTLILACRSAQRAETARTNLYKLIDKEIAKSNTAHAQLFRKNLDIEIVKLDLSSVESVFECAADIPVYHHLILNAGVGDFVGINWPLAIWEVCTRFKTAVTAPGFKIQATGKMSSSATRNARSQPLSSSRVLWTTSLEGRPSFFPGIDDYQLVSASHSYEASKYESELVACALDELESERNNGVRHLAVHPGVAGTNIFWNIPGGFWIKSCFLHFTFGVGQARLFGSKHHPIQTYKAAISVVHVALVSLAVLPSLTTFGATNEKSGQPPEGVSGGNEKRSRAEDYSPVRYGAETNIFGTGYVGVQPVEGYEEHREVGRELVARCNRLYNAFEKKFKM